MWGGNIDFSLLVDDFQVVNYVAKRCAKSETPSGALKTALKTKRNVATEETSDHSRWECRVIFWTGDMTRQ